MNWRRNWLGWALGFFVLLVLGGCNFSIPTNTPDMKQLQKDVNPEWELTDLNPYIIKTTYHAGKKKDEIWGYPVEIRVKVNQEFEKLSRKEQFESMVSTQEDLKRFVIVPQCGTVDCYFNSLVVTYGEHQYSMVFAYDFTHDVSRQDAVMVVKGDKEYTEASFMGNDSINNAPANSEPSSLSYDDKVRIHDYMDEVFNQMTNQGDTYNPEVDDPKIAAIAAQHFGITAEQADQAYLEIATKGN
jgi:hypothetical protein